jgi:tetratricopeptide (TPR) repeat protein
LNAESALPKAQTPEEAAALDRLAALGYIGGDRSDPTTSKLNLGHHYMSTGRFQDALDQYMSVWKTDATPQVAAAIAGAWIALGDLAKAGEWAQKALALDPTDVAAQVSMIRIHLRNGEPEKARGILEVTLGAHGDLPAVHVVGGQVWEALEDVAKKAKNDAGAEEARTRALELYGSALRLEPNDPQAATLRANLLLSPRPWNPQQSVDPEGTAEALRLYDHALRIRPGYPLWLNNRSIAHLRMGMLAREAGRADECEKHLLSAVASADEGITSWRDRTGKEYAKAWANRAYALWQLDRLDDAAESARKALATEPGYTLSPRFVAKMKETGRKLSD